METAKMTIRISRDELRKLQEAAAKDKRSVNGQVLYYVQQGLKDQQHA